jgi:hypothetical protein
MSLRIGFDMDGVLADFSSAYHAVEERLFGVAPPAPVEDPEEEAGAQDESEVAEATSDQQRRDGRRRRRDAIWQAIQATPDFWFGLDALDRGAVARIHQMTLRHRWEVFFITQRPATDGDVVQRQTQRWLVAQGFDLPSVLVIAGSRGAAAAALRLDYHVDDSTKNCIDVKAESGAKPLLILDTADADGVSTAHRLGIGTAGSISECLDILEQASISHRQPTLLHRLAQLVGWH